MNVINDERFVPLIAQKVLNHLKEHEVPGPSSILSFLNFSGFMDVTPHLLSEMADGALSVYAQNCNLIQDKKMKLTRFFDDINEERFAFELKKALMANLKLHDSDMYYNIFLTLESEYPEDISIQMMDDLVRGGLNSFNSKK